MLQALGKVFTGPAVRLSDKRLLGAFASKTPLPIHADHGSVTALPTDTRLAIFERLTAAARPYDIEVHPCACKNPDIARGSCRIAGRRPAASARPMHFDLFK